MSIFDLNINYFFDKYDLQNNLSKLSLHPTCFYYQLRIFSTNYLEIFSSLMYKKYCSGKL